MCSWSSIANTFQSLGRGRGEGGSGLNLPNNSGNVHQILLSRYFREELKQRLCGKAPEGLGELHFLRSRRDGGSGREGRRGGHTQCNFSEMHHNFYLTFLLFRLSNFNMVSVLFPPFDFISVCMSWESPCAKRSQSSLE